MDRTSGPQGSLQPCSLVWFARHWALIAAVGRGLEVSGPFPRPTSACREPQDGRSPNDCPESLSLL